MITIAADIGVYEADEDKNDFDEVPEEGWPSKIF